jgi:hypothetical protein
MKIIFAYATPEDKLDISLIKFFGYDTIIGNFSSDKMNEMLALGIGCIKTNGYVEHDAIIGYYLYDEPDLWKVSIADQDAKIAEYRAKTNKPLSIAMIEQVERKCSMNFDTYLIDIYYNTKTLSKFVNYVNVAFSSMTAQILYKGKNVVPIMGIFDDNTLYDFSNEQLPFARKFRSYFKTNDQSTFLWSGDKVTINGIIDKPEYRVWAKTLNDTTDKCWWITRVTLYTVAWLFLKINPLFGKHRITI